MPKYDYDPITGDTIYKASAIDKVLGAEKPVENDWEAQKRKRRLDALSYRLPGYSEDNPYASGNKLADVSSNFLLPLMAVAEVIGTKGKSQGQTALSAAQNIEAGKIARLGQASAFEKERKEKAQDTEKELKALASAKYFSSLANAKTPEERRAAVTEYMYATDPSKAVENEAKLSRQAKLDALNLTTQEGRDAYRKMQAVESPDEYVKFIEKEEDSKLSQVNSLRGEFNNLSKDYTKVADSYARVKAASINPSAAGDLALIFNYMKILDPGSVVRESEFATAQNAAGIPERIRNIWNRALTGERLADAQRIDFLDRSKKLYQAQENRQQQNIQRYARLAKVAGADPIDVVGDLPNFPTEEAARAAGFENGDRVKINGVSGTLE